MVYTTSVFRFVLQLNADLSKDMSLQEQNRSQGTGVTKDEVELIKSNLATVFSNGRNIFYEKGKINICESIYHTLVIFGRRQMCRVYQGSRLKTV